MKITWLSSLTKSRAGNHAIHNGMINECRVSFSRWLGTTFFIHHDSCQQIYRTETFQRTFGYLPNWVDHSTRCQFLAKWLVLIFHHAPLLSVVWIRFQKQGSATPFPFWKSKSLFWFKLNCKDLSVFDLMCAEMQLQLTHNLLFLFRWLQREMSNFSMWKWSESFPFTHQITQKLQSSVSD